MPASRAGACAAAAIVLAAAPARADHWPLIDVKARLANDGRVTVVETHQIAFKTTGKKVLRGFALGADQEIRLTALTRVGPDDAEHPLRPVDEATGPDEYRHYGGHVYFTVPALGDEVSLTYRFEYELVGGIAPAWGIAAGPESRGSSDLALTWPWHRAGQVVDDWRRAWPKLGRRYRYDHDVLFPDREPGQTFRQIDYQLTYDTAWRDVEPERDIGDAVPSGAFRTGKLYDYLRPGVPLHASSAAAAQRLLALAIVPIAGIAGWLLVVVVDRRRRSQPVDRTFVEQRFLSRAPEEIAFWFSDRKPTVEGILSRLAGEGAIAIEVHRSPPIDGDDALGPVRLQMRRVAPDASLTHFEQAMLDEVFGPERELTTESHARRHRGKDYDPDDGLAVQLGHLERIKRGDAGGRPRRAPEWNAARFGMAMSLAFGLYVVLQHLGRSSDILPIGAVFAFFMIALVNAWPTGWWHPGLAVRGLLVPLVLLYAMQLAWLLMPNRPLPATGWLGMALVALAGYDLTLARARMPTGQGGVLADLSQIRAFAARELKQPRPQLDDRWIPRLRALGMGKAIDRWRERHRSGGFITAPTPAAGDPPRVTSATFTGVGPEPFKGPDGWASSLAVWAEDEHEHEGDDDQDDAGAMTTTGREGETR